MMVGTMEINVLIDGADIPLGEVWLEGVARQVLAAEEAGSDVEMGVVVTSQERVQELNRTYRGIDEPTDVLAFGEETGAVPFVSAPDGVRHLGEVIISYPQALAQADEHHHPVERETALLITHGVLHLLGYDHEKPEEERRMRAREAQILSVIEGGEA